MAAVEIVQRDVELIDASSPERKRPLGSEHPAVRDQRDIGQTDRIRDPAHDVLEVTPEQGLATREGHHERIEVPRGGRKTRLFAGAGRGIGPPVVAEPAPGITPERHLEMHEDRLPHRGQVQRTSR